MNKTRSTFVIILLLCTLGGAWLLYPYSFLSVQKMVSFTSDELVVQEYNENLNDFRGIHEENAREDLVNYRTESILQMYNQNWLTNEETVQIHYQDIDTMLNEVKNARSFLLELAFLEGYSQAAKEYLKLNIQQCIAIEEAIIALKNSTFSSKTALNLQLKNLQGAFEITLDTYVSFYQDYLSKDTTII